jgi:putative endonuclease
MRYVLFVRDDGLDWAILLLLATPNEISAQCTQQGGFVYIVANAHRTVLYIGVTADLPKRVDAHAAGTGADFPAKYNCTDLIYYEELPTIELAIAREKTLKKWRREWKLELIRTINPALEKLHLY